MVAELIAAQLETATGMPPSAVLGGQDVYFARAANGSIKIGISRNADARVRELKHVYRMAHRLLLTVAGCRLHHEKALHALLRHETACASREHFSGPDTEMVLAKLLSLKRASRAGSARWYAKHLLASMPGRGISDSELRRIG